MEGSINTGNIDCTFTSAATDDPPGLSTSPRASCTLVQLPSGCEWQCTFAGLIEDFLNAQTEPIIEPDGKTITVILSNAWPCYYPKVFFDITNNGSVPVKIESILVEEPVVPYDCDGDGTIEPGEEAKAITAEISGVAVGTEIDAGSTVSGQLQIHATDAIVPEGIYQFSVTFTVWNWNEVGP